MGRRQIVFLPRELLHVFTEWCVNRLNQQEREIVLDFQVRDEWFPGISKKIELHASLDLCLPGARLVSMFGHWLKGMESVWWFTSETQKNVLLTYPCNNKKNRPSQLAISVCSPLHLTCSEIVKRTWKDLTTPTWLSMRSSSYLIVEGNKTKDVIVPVPGSQTKAKRHVKVFHPRMPAKQAKVVEAALLYQVSVSSKCTEFPRSGRGSSGGLHGAAT